MDLPELTTIQLGNHAFAFINEESSTLIMRCDCLKHY